MFLKYIVYMELLNVYCNSIPRANIIDIDYYVFLKQYKQARSKRLIGYYHQLNISWSGNLNCGLIQFMSRDKTG
jgi:hypothetical protein